MTHPWALSKSKLKKIFFKYAVINLNSKYISAVISENEEESIHISNFFKKSKKYLSLIILLNYLEYLKWDKNAARIMFTLDEYQSKKVFNNLVELWSELSRRDITKDSILNIYGIGFGKYYNEFKRKLSESVGVRFHGQVYGQEKSNDSKRKGAYT